MLFASMYTYRGNMSEESKKRSRLRWVQWRGENP